MKMIKEELLTGVHNRPKEYPYFIAKSYFNIPIELEKEIESVGFNTINKYAIEGSMWITPSLDENSRATLLEILKYTENEDSIMGMSPHFMIVSKKGE